MLQHTESMSEIEFKRHGFTGSDTHILFSCGVTRERVNSPADRAVLPCSVSSRLLGY